MTPALKGSIQKLYDLNFDKITVLIVMGTIFNIYQNTENFTVGVRLSTS